MHASGPAIAAWARRIRLSLALWAAGAALASALGLSAWLPLPLTALGIGAIEKPLPSRFDL